MSDHLKGASEEKDSSRWMLITAICVVGVSIALSTVFVLIGKKVESLQVTKDIVLPKAEDAVPMDPRSTVYVDELGGVWMDGKSVSLEELSGRLVELKLNRVLVKADQSCSYEKLKLVLGEIGKTGIKNVGLSVEGKEVPKSSPYSP